jgi:hypothetical protein
MAVVATIKYVPSGTTLALATWSRIHLGPPPLFSLLPHSLGVFVAAAARPFATP